MSPDTAPWDSPFPTFPGAKKKTAAAEEQEIVQKMANVDMYAPNKGRPRTGGSKGSHDRYPNGETDDFGYPAGLARNNDDYGRPSMEGQRRPFPQGRGQPRSPQDYPNQRGPQQGYGPPSRQHTYAGEPGYQGYGDGEFSPPSRSMTMPTNVDAGPSGGRQPMPPGPGPHRQPAMMDPLGPSAPYNGPIGRSMPPRPSTASGARPPPVRTYPDQPMPQQHAYGHGQSDSVSDLYDSYYDSRVSNPPGPEKSPMPDFDAVPEQNNATNHRRGNSIEGHFQPGPKPSFEPQGGSQYNAYQSQPEYRTVPQPQSAVIETAGEAPSVPNMYDQGYGNQYGQYNQQGQGYGYDQPGYGPSRSASASQAPLNGLPSGPKQGFAGLPPGPRSHSLPKDPVAQAPPPNPDALPSHPAPVRPGLMPSPGASQQNKKPPPVRNYNNTTPTNQQPTQPPLAPKKEAEPAVTGPELEMLRSKAKNMPNDQAVQYTLAKKLAEASETLVLKLADQKSRNKAREKYVMDAHKILKKLVNAQYPDAMFYLADCYGRGALGLEADNKEAFTLYQNAAKAGHPAAAYRTAVCCELGNEEGGGTRKDPGKAIQWYRRAATLGDSPAMYKMGMIQLKGLLGQPKNQHEAVVWLKRAAERADAENPHALHELALLYEAPSTPDSPIQRDENYSFELFNHAADLGYKFAQFRLGCTYEYGLFNQPIDPRQSIMWYSRAAVQEEHQSEMALSGWYLTGAEKILQQSDTEAYLWARKAALAGLAKAEYAMGYFTEVGIGAPANLEDAKRWYWRAAGEFLSSHPSCFCSVLALFKTWSLAQSRWYRLLPEEANRFQSTKLPQSS